MSTSRAYSQDERASLCSVLSHHHSHTTCRVVRVRSLTIGGPATILNNSKDVIHAGDTIAWTFFSEDGTGAGTTSKARAAHGSVRRIGIRVADFHDEVSSPNGTNRQPPHFVFDANRFQIRLFPARSARLDVRSTSLSVSTIIYNELKPSIRCPGLRSHTHI